MLAANQKRTRRAGYAGPAARIFFRSRDAKDYDDAISIKTPR